MPLLFEVLAFCVFYYCLWQVLQYLCGGTNLHYYWYLGQRVQESEFEKFQAEAAQHLEELKDAINEQMIYERAWKEWEWWQNDNIRM